MEIIQSFYINYSTVSTILTALITFGAAVFLLKLPNHSRATTYLGLMFLFIAIPGTGYFLNNGLYYPSSFSRYLTLISIPMRFTLLAQFLIYFPRLRNPKFAKWSLIVQCIISALLGIWLLAVGPSSELYFDLSGQSYDLKVPLFFKGYSVFLILFILFAMGIAVRKALTHKGEERTAVIIIIIALILDMVIPTAINAMNRNGYISRDALMAALGMLTPVGTFLILIAFINTTKDKSTFLFKIVGISFLTFVFVYNIIIYVFMQDKEFSYDEDRVNDLKLVLKAGERPANLDYLMEYRPSTGEIKFSYNRNETQIAEFEPKLINSYFVESLRLFPENFTAQEIIAKLDSIPIRNSQYLEPHKLSLKDYLSSYSGKKPVNDSVQFLVSKERTLYYHSNKIKEMSEKDFRDELKAYFAKTPPEMARYKEAILRHSETTSSGGPQLKLELLRYLTPVLPEGKRIVRESADRKSHFLAYQESSPDLVHELGFSYIGYRKFIHSTGKFLTYILLVSIFLFFIGTPLFMKGALVTPLENLLNGLRKVRKGNLTVEVPVKVQDEIGYLTTSFNGMVKSIRESKEKLEEYSNQLEEKVKERTKELRYTLDQVENLKNQQDGDYFLTTLLLKPLGIKTVDNNGKVAVDFFVKQKKEFQFRKRDMEIGGDLCSSQEIFLRGKKYIVFLNADAMGKSMQGAGGILVLGAVFQSIIQRTSAYQTQSEVPPEMWIKSAFKEMHKIFESFDGSMLVSLIFGLVEADTGLVYYINAEHPWMILYRDGIADFAERDSYFRKLGTSGVKNEIFVSTFRMMPGDLLIIGSDGKDDVVLSEAQENSDRVINEDETLILKRVEEAKGDLNGIFKVITGKYKLMDDLSLMSIYYKGETEEDIEEKSKITKYIKRAAKYFQDGNYETSLKIMEEARTVHPFNFTLVNYTLQLYMKMKMFDKGAELCRQYLKSNEANTSFMIKASYCLKMNQDLEAAIEIAERVKLREPGNVRNLIHLSDMYAYTKNWKRAKKLLDKVKLIDPGNQKAEKVRHVLEDAYS
ncbi:MAG TPA: SpoIIE family protein phosphatase [Leptospiraceae bacterium]|nr:SpoIIE family protein phosphatase [Leptospiraceae bacterium]HNF12699.1 SpoIIE family protein phosphatase [Leptospiraceae bacterium]HNF23487.1 SpoIIE family protein phosphatase [Leptospiraceae bacterium]HNI95230.1 SpoIIE family protein phosphatase [Leptospiraceae bacterium]HNM03206.1 SpoIIE family protein phosphatase [Leptospiraceae bacterium]